MRRILYNMEFKGRGEQKTDGEYIWITRAFAPCMRFTTEITGDGGSGIFENAKGIITSNFLVDDDSDVVDYHTGVIFVP